jgi:hypothetical protein
MSRAQKLGAFVAVLCVFALMDIAVTAFVPATRTYGAVSLAATSALLLHATLALWGTRDNDIVDAVDTTVTTCPELMERHSTQTTTAHDRVEMHIVDDAAHEMDLKACAEQHCSAYAADETDVCESVVPEFRACKADAQVRNAVAVSRQPFADCLRRRGCDDRAVATLADIRETNSQAVNKLLLECERACAEEATAGSSIESVALLDTVHGTTCRAMGRPTDDDDPRRHAYAYENHATMDDIDIDSLNVMTEPGRRAFVARATHHMAWPQYEGPLDQYASGRQGS